MEIIWHISIDPSKFFQSQLSPVYSLMGKNWDLRTELKTIFEFNNRELLHEMDVFLL